MERARARVEVKGLQYSDRNGDSSTRDLDAYAILCYMGQLLTESLNGISRYFRRDSSHREPIQVFHMLSQDVPGGPTSVSGGQAAKEQHVAELRKNRYH